MSEDLFTNPHSQIPDELWKTPSPMERQLAAVEYWADLTSEKRASKKDPRKLAKLKDALRNNRVAATAAATGTLAGAESLYSTRRDKKTGLTLRQKRILEQEAAKRVRENLSGKSGFIADKIFEADKKLAKMESDSPRAAAVTKAGLGAGVGAVLAKRLMKGR